MALDQKIDEVINKELKKKYESDKKTRATINLQLFIEDSENLYAKTGITEQFPIDDQVPITPIFTMKPYMVSNKLSSISPYKDAIPIEDTLENTLQKYFQEGSYFLYSPYAEKNHKSFTVMENELLFIISSYKIVWP